MSSVIFLMKRTHTEILMMDTTVKNDSAFFLSLHKDKEIINAPRVFLRCCAAVILLALSGCQQNKVHEEKKSNIAPASAAPTTAPTTGGLIQHPPEIPLSSPPAIILPAERTPPIRKSTKPKKPESAPAPIIRNYDWRQAIVAIIDDKSIQGDGSQRLFVSKVANKTNGAINQNNATSSLIDVFSHYAKFQIVTESMALKMRKQLADNDNDVLQTRNKAISLARISGAQYLLYSWVTGTVQNAVMNIHMIEVNTGLLDYAGKRQLTPDKTVIAKR